MWGELLTVVGLGLLCGGWVLFQRWIARVDPEAPGVEGGCCGSGGGDGGRPRGELVVLGRRRGR